MAVTTTGMAHHIHVFETRRHRDDAALRQRLFADAHGPDPAAARAALDTLARLYYGLRLPLVEARLYSQEGHVYIKAPAAIEARLNGQGGEIAARPAAARNDGRAA